MKSFLKDGDETTASNPTSFPQPPSDNKNLAPGYVLSGHLKH